MKTAFIGQRVRIIASDMLPPIVGKEATVLAMPSVWEGEEGTLIEGMQWLGVPVCVDGIGETCLIDNARFTIVPRLSSLEPILPEGAAPSEYTAEELFELLNINITEGEIV